MHRLKAAAQTFTTYSIIKGPIALCSMMLYACLRIHISCREHITFSRTVPRLNLQTIMRENHTTPPLSSTNILRVSMNTTAQTFIVIAMHKRCKNCNVDSFKKTEPRFINSKLQVSLPQYKRNKRDKKALPIHYKNVN